MSYQLRLVYREIAPNPGVFSVLFTGRKFERWHKSYFRQSPTGLWVEEKGGLPSSLQFCGVMLEQWSPTQTKVIHDVPGLHAYAEPGASEERAPAMPLDTFLTGPQGLHSSILAEPANQNGGKSVERMTVWVRLPSALGAFEPNEAPNAGQSDYLWLKYVMYPPITGRQIHAFVVGSSVKRLGLYVENTPESVLEYGYNTERTPVAWRLEGTKACHAQRTLGVQPVDALMYDWVPAGGAGPRQLVFRRRFRAPGFGPDPFLLSDAAAAKSSDITLVQRPAMLVLEAARELPQVPDLGGAGGTAGMWTSASWTLQASTEHFTHKAGTAAGKPTGVLTSAENKEWTGFFSRGWKALMGTVEPNIKSGTLALLELNPAGADLTDKTKFSPFPLGALVTRVSQSLATAHPGRLDHLVIGKPPLRQGRAEVPGTWEAEFPALRNHHGDGLKCGLRRLRSVVNRKEDWQAYATDGDAVAIETLRTYGLQLLFDVGAIKSGVKSPIRAGGLDLLLLEKAEKDVQMNDSAASYIFRSRKLAEDSWNQYIPLQLCWWGMGYLLPGLDKQILEGDQAYNKAKDAGRKAAPERQPLRLPLAGVMPGETDHRIEETELFSQDGGLEVSRDRPLLITLPNRKALKKKAQPAAPGQGTTSPAASGEVKPEFTLEIDQVKGLNYSEITTLRVIRAFAGPTDTAWIDARLFYLDRAPFFVCLVDTNTYSGDKLSAEDKAGSEIAYWTTEGIFRGWQRRAKSGEFRLVLPAQGVGEEMEKGRKADGYADLEEGKRVKFRFTSSTLLTLDASDLARRYHSLPWNLRMQLNALQPNRLVGLPTKMASFEMLYGLRFTLKDVPSLRLAELLARQGYPKSRLAAQPPKFTESEYWDLKNEGVGVYQGAATANWENLKKAWDATLRLVESRLAVYELFNDGPEEFDENGQPKELELEARRGEKHLRAELRKAADLHTSLPSQRGTQSGELARRGPIIDIDPEVLVDRTRDLTSEDALKAREAAAWWRKLVPHYEHGLAGSMAWAFESKLVYESLWSDKDHLETPAVVEGVEATVARLYFSALGGWGMQQASFANGKIVVAVSVEMGRVSELRVEVIGRIGTFKNKAKLVTVFRRTVLPTRQFVSQQDALEGRAVLRKVEEWVEFIHKNRTLQEKLGSEAGSLKACSCEERILVDSRWGMDVYTPDGDGVAWKVPIRKCGADPDIYGPANVLIHFHTHCQSKAKEACGNIENLDNLWFWTAVSQKDEQLGDDTDKWADLVGVDCFPKIKEDPTLTNPAAMKYGAAAVPGGGGPCTFRIAGLTQEADLSHYQPNDEALAPDEQTAVGSVTRTITVFRDSYPETQPPLEGLVSSARDIMGEAENVLGFIEQMTTRQAGEVITGWEGAAEKFLGTLGGANEAGAALRSKITDALRPVLTASDQVARMQESLKRSLATEFQHLEGQWADLRKVGDSMVTAARGKAMEKADEVESAILSIREKVSTHEKAVADALQVKLKGLVETAVTKARELRKAVYEKSGALPTAIDTVLGKLVNGKLDQKVMQWITQPEADLLMAVAKRRMNELAGREVRGISLTKEVLIKAWRQVVDDIMTHTAVTALEKLDVAAVNFRREATEVLKAVLPGVAAKPGPLKDLLDRLEEEMRSVSQNLRQKQAVLRVLLRSEVEKAALLVKEVEAVSGLMLAKCEELKKLEERLAVMHKDLEQRVLDLVDEAAKNADEMKVILTTKLPQQCRNHFAAMVKRVDAVAEKLGGVLVDESVLLARAQEVLKRNTDIVSGIEGEVEEKLKQVGTEAAGWVKEQRAQAQGAWEKLQGDIKGDVDSAFGKLDKLVAGIPKPADLCTKLNKHVTRNIDHAIQQGTGMLRGLAADVARELRQPLLRVEKVLADHPDLTDALKRDLAAAATALDTGVRVILDDAQGLWKKTAGKAQGTVGQAQALLGDGLDQVGKLKGEISALLLPLPPVGTVVADAVLKKARRAADAARAQMERLDHLCQLPWFRGLPNKIGTEGLKRLLKEFELVVSQLPELDLAKGLIEWQTATVQALTEVEAQINGARLKCAELEAEVSNELISGAQGLEQVKTVLSQKITGLAANLRVAAGSLDAAARKAILEQTGQAKSTLDDLENSIEEAVKKEAEAIKKVVAGKLVGGCDALGSLLELDPKAVLSGLVQQLGKLPNLEFFERGLGDAGAWLNQQRDHIGGLVGRFGGLKDELSLKPLKLGAGAPATLFRSFGKVPSVPGLDFNGMAKFAEGAQAEFAAHLGNFSSRFRSVGYEFKQAAADAKKELLVRMSPVKAMVDRTRNALGEAAQEARMKAASLEMMVSDVKRQVEAKVDQMKNDAKLAVKDLLPDFGGIKLEKLLGAAGVSEKFIDDLKRCSKITHGVDKKTLSAWVDSKVEGLVLDQSLTLFSFGPVALCMKQVTMDSHIRIQTNTKGETQKLGEGKIVANWEVAMGGQPLITYEQAKLECKNGKMSMELDPNKVRMPSMLQMLADMMSRFSYKDDSGLAVGLRLNLPKEVTGYVTFNMDFPPMGGGTTSLQNLRLSLLFELSLVFPRFPSLKDAHLRISAGAGLSDSESPFILGVFILGGCGWFQMRLDYVVPFKDGKPYLAVKISVAIGLSASLCINLGFATGQVYIALAVEIECYISKGKSNNRFSIVLTIAGVLDILGGLISVYLLLSLGISYASGQPMVGRGRVCLTIRICWCVKIKVDKSFQYTFGKGFDRSAQSGAADERAPKLVEASPERQRVPVTAPADYHRQASRMVV
ncbi:MAG: hypothetical protein V4662_27015 [Verrucomicrobiota bacterium]